MGTGWKREIKKVGLQLYETVHKKAGADAKKKKECEESMEESSRSAEQHAGKNDKTAFSVKEY